MSIRPPTRFVREGLVALVVTAAAAGACATLWWIGTALGAGGSPAVLATVVALSLGRRTFASRAEFVRSAALLPVVGVAAGAVGWLLVAVPPVGAALFVAGMSIPIWMRRFGPRVARAAGLMALPLTATLIAPVAPPPHAPWWLVAVLALLAGFAAALWVGLARELLRVIPSERALGAATAPPPARTSSRLPASTRMALQMAVALVAAFVVGWAVFPGHAMWVVLTAFLVCSGNRGRADVLHKSALRILGALGGSVAAVALVVLVPQVSGFGAVAVIFAALFAGTWLRSVSYAFWALAVTLVLSLLQELLGVASLSGETGMLVERMLAIVAGAALGIAASWFVLPVRSTDVLRRRLSDMLTALTAALAPAEGDAAPRAARLAAFGDAVARVEELAPAHRAARLVTGRRRVLPIDCIEAAGALPDALRARFAAPAEPDRSDRERLRAAIGDARRSLAAPVELARVQASLRSLQRALTPPPA